jgi:hypothetical protein
MTTSSEHPDASAQADAAATSLLPEDAQAAVAEIKADNAALKVADQIAEVQAEATEEQAKLLNQMTGEVVGELQERQQAAGED